MPIDVDPSFKKTGDKARERQLWRQTGENARRRHRRRKIRRIAIMGGGGFGILLIAFIGWMVARSPSDGGGGVEGSDVAELSGLDPEDDDFTMVQADEAQTDFASSSFTPVLPADIQVDPMILRVAQEGEGNVQYIAGPQDFLPARVGPPGSQRFAYLREPLVAAEQTLELVLPSSRDDFALFQAQRSQASPPGALPQQPQKPSAPVEAGDLVTVEEDSSWGDLITTDDDALQSEGQSESAAVYVETRIENTTSTVLALRESERHALYEDVVTALQTERPLVQVLTSSGFSASDAAAIARAAETRLFVPEKLAGGSIVAVRYRQNDFGRELIQMSVYGPEGYIGTLVRLGEGRYDSGADPWFSENLTDRTGELVAQAQEAKEVRIIDAIYSTALSNGLSQTLVGQLILILSKDFDLDRFASDGDYFSVLYANTPGPEGDGLGRVLYVGIEGPSGTLTCYVTDGENEGEFACFDFNATTTGGGGGAIGGGMVVPVKGVKTSGFGPRHHPILKQVRNHDGVDWAAPTGTPIVSAMNGTVEYAGPGGGYGNVIYIDHGNGQQTRYAHMSKYGAFKKGDRVKAGDVIGYVGTTGRSTGPHLHFELRVNGTPVDPLSYRASVTVAAVSDGGQPGSAAVEQLVNKIIKVESAGNARAKNPLSTATGLGQFIESTWLRMMRDYRPDLANSMSRAALLELRFDPSLSREMVRNLAREGEAYLRSRGHTITPGNLYLCHFLGAGGAAKALSASREASVLDVMGAGVVGANPFLRGKTIGELIAWSDRKMLVRGQSTAISSAPAIPAPRAVPEEIKAFRETVDTLLKEAKAKAEGIAARAAEEDAADEETTGETVEDAPEND
ncbi:peptidoglycan DD-metalloendopeptidase family protein [Sagittula stellata]|uniref:M23ase beta-sheet core domain-containing protein n=1 Tax=Sagittula stellata (strain ATCC 700073 / DSM 11524 / E-37) TaxID=388399 RepID=A3KAQ0_SAGS3|nr:M23 family metallopeptidase [Sagittula stellata]EBA05756.1 hypothetical protein SSE37_03055 [Sagittula stellata E-37]